MSRITKVNIAGQIYNLQDERLDATNIKWSSSFDMNNFKEQGIYYISGERLQSETDNLPINNAASGHSISGQLTVLDASLSQDEQCITQYLKLTNRTGSEGKEYIRTYNRFKDGREEWGDWQKLQTNIEVNAIGVGQSKTFNDLTDNGIYSGVNVYWIDQANYLTSFETFVLVVINAYLTGGGISQLKYSTLVDGTTTVMTRTMINGQWSEWKSVGGSENESILLSGSGTFQIDGDKIKTIYLTSVGPGIGYYNITVTKSTIIDVVLFDTAYDKLHFDVNNTGIYTPTISNQAGMYRLAIDMASKTLMVSTINNDANINRF